MDLKLYNTLTRTKEAFIPLDWQGNLPEAERRVRMYVCGPTVYDFAHIGNARPVIVFDVLFRLLRHVYGDDRVTYVRNITDVDDKINARAAERGITIRELTETTYANFRDDVKALGCLPPTVEPRATEHIEEMKALIERLVAGGHAYVAEGHVLFGVPSMADYGRLSRRPLDEMIAGARVDVAPYKRDAMDFVLWKPSKAGEPGWDSPCGIAQPGRPGWHIECSAMAWKHLGETFDIHGGGIDLLFPHHENEVAQTRCAFDAPLMAQVWMHNGFLQVEGEKMSKSLGNFITIRELLQSENFGGRSWPGEVLRLAMLMTHYRQPIDFTIDRLVEAESKLTTWGNLLLDLSMWDLRRPPSPELVEILSDDLNTPEAISFLIRQENSCRSSEDNTRQFGADMCFLGAAPFQFLQQHFDASNEALAQQKIEILTGVEKTKIALEELGAQTVRVIAALQRGIDVAFVKEMISARNAARKAKNFAESDRIRDELAAMGVVLKDSKDGTTWEVAR